MFFWKVLFLVLTVLGSTLFSFGTGFASNLGATFSTQTQTWSGPNGFVLTGSQTVGWDDPNAPYDSIRSSSQVSGQYQPMMNLYSDGRAEDRCQYQNGAWESWYQFAFAGPVSVYGSYIQTPKASGQYITCSVGHEYRFSSLHTFSGNGYNSGDKWIYFNQ